MLAVFDIGGTHIRAAASPEPGCVLAATQRHTPDGGFSVFAASLRQMMPDGATGAALSMPGGAHPETGVMRIANVHGLDGRAAAADLAQALGLPVVVANDADCFALAEAASGAGVGHRVVFGVILGTGVGGGLVIDGHIHAGASGLAGEWGHGPVFPTIAAGHAVPGLPCGCGKTGCVETIGGARGLERLHRHLHGQNAPAKVIAAGAADAAETLAVWAAAVAGPLAMVVNTLGASVLPVGGGLARAPGLVARLDAAVRARVLVDPGPGLLRPATAGDEPGLLGAAILGWRMLRKAAG